MSPTDFLTVIIYILALIILGGTWFFLTRLNKSLQRISNELQNTINKLEEGKLKWIY